MASPRRKRDATGQLPPTYAAPALPTEITAELVGDLLAEMATGRTIVEMCKERGISEKAVRQRIWDDERMAGPFARARELQAHALAEQVIPIASDESLNPQHQKNQIDARKWLASKLAPSTYGDRLAVDHAGTIAIQPVITRWSGPAPDGAAADRVALPAPEPEPGP